MEWVRANWFWIILFAVFIGIHLFGHGGAHGGHGGHGSHGGKTEGDEHKGHAEGSQSKKEGGGGCH